MPRPERRPPATKAQPLIKGGTCRCALCLEWFASLGDYKWHRVGSYGERRCLTRTQMRGRDMKMDTRSRWHKRKEATA